LHTRVFVLSFSFLKNPEQPKFVASRLPPERTDLMSSFIVWDKHLIPSLQSLKSAEKPSNANNNLTVPPREDFYSLVLRKPTTPNPVRVNLRNSGDLSKGDTVAVRREGPLVLDWSRGHSSTALSELPPLSSDWEYRLLCQYYSEEQISKLSENQQHELYSWLCSDPLQLLFYPIFGLSKLSYSYYCKALNDYREEQPFPEAYVRTASQLVEQMNDRWRHGSLTHLHDLRLEHSYQRCIVTQVLRSAGVGFRDGWLCWPYPQQVASRLDCVLSDWQPCLWPLEQLHSDDVWLQSVFNWLNEGGLRALPTVAYGLSKQRTLEQLGQRLLGYVQAAGALLLDCNSICSLQALYDETIGHPNVVLLNVDSLPLFSLLQFVTTFLNNERHMLGLQYNALSSRSSSVQYLQACSWPRFHLQLCSPNYPQDALCYEEELRLESPSLYAENIEAGMLVGFEPDRIGMSFMPSTMLCRVLDFFAEQRLRAPQDWTYGLVVATEHDREQVLPLLNQRLFGSPELQFRAGLRCSPPHYRPVPALVLHEQPLTLRLCDGSAAELACESPRQLECLTLGELSFSYNRIIFYSSVPIEAGQFRYLLNHCGDSLTIISDSDKLCFEPVYY
jgi:hypothetical protein